MQSEQLDQQNEVSKPMNNKVLENHITNQIKERLGIPTGLIKIASINVYGNKWRVNVWCRIFNEAKNVKEAIIKHSYFVTADNEGNLLRSLPKIDKLY